MENEENTLQQHEGSRNKPVNENRPTRQLTDEEDVIDLREVFLHLKNNRKRIYKIVAGFFLVGILVAILTPVEYTATTTLLPEKNSAANNTAKGLLQSFGLGGIFSNSSNNGETISPTLYPDVIKSTPSMAQLIEQKVYFSDLDTTITVDDYFMNFYHAGFLKGLKKYTIGLPGMVIRWISGPNKNAKLPVAVDEFEENMEKDTTMSHLLNNSQKNLQQLSRSDLSVIGLLTNRIDIDNTNSTNETIELTVTMPDPVAAAAVTQKAVDILTAYITDYKISKVKLNLKFIQGRYNDAKEQFIKSQNALAKFRDENMNINLASARSQEQRLQAEYDLNYDLFKSLAQQLEQAKIQVQEETPAFNVLEPVQIPIQKSAPNVIKILIIFVFLGVFAGMGYVLWGDFVGKFRTANHQ